MVKHDSSFDKRSFGEPKSSIGVPLYENYKGGSLTSNNRYVH
jgi:hypothetical protein